MNKILDMISAGIEDGSLARFLFTLAAVVMLMYLTYTKAISTDVALAFIGTVTGYFFGAQTKQQPPKAT